MEGSATAAYFSGYRRHFDPCWRFENRNRRPPTDPINVLLSFDVERVVVMGAGKGSTSWQLRRELHRRGFFYLLPETPYPRLDFWLRLAIIAGLLNQPSHPVMLPQPWRLEGEKLIVPYPPGWSLLWELERFVWPTGPGEYLLGESAIPGNAQHAGFSHFGALVQTLEGGLKHSLPPLLRAALQPEPALQVMHGVILAFEQPSAIIELRRLRSWRKDLANLLSSRHVLIEHSQARRILQKLASKGLLSTTILQASLEELGLARKADHQAAEPRRITPLLLERRGSRHY